MPHGIDDLGVLRIAVKDAAFRAFSAMRASHANEALYAYALYSDDGAMTVCSAANSEEALARTIADYGEDAAEDLAYLRWSPGEWAFEAEESEQFERVYGILDALRRPVPESEFPQFRDAVFEAILGALDDLNREGFFGTGADREAVTVLFTISDSDDSELWERRSVKQLNPASVYTRFTRDGEAL